MMRLEEGRAAVEGDLLDGLARGLLDLDGHRWSGASGSDRSSLLPTYRREAERFLLPHVERALAAGPGAGRPLGATAPAPRGPEVAAAVDEAGVRERVLAWIDEAPEHTPGLDLLRQIVTPAAVESATPRETGEHNG